MTAVRLALDTATDRLSVAADRGPRSPPVLLDLEGDRRHATDILPLVDRVLEQLGATSAEIRLVALSDGPGSFTGLRVGVAVAKALVRGGGAGLVTASTLLVRAAGAARAGQRVLAVSEALRGEVYAGAWAFRPTDVVELARPRPVGLAELRTYPPVDLIVGDGPDDLIGELERARGVPVVRPGWPSAAALLTLADTPGGCRRVEDPVTWEPEYGRPAEAQARWEERHGRPLPDPRGRPR